MDNETMERDTRLCRYPTRIENVIADVMCEYTSA
jgi:hypothetical protein